jgi:hypothetical protein
MYTYLQMKFFNKKNIILIILFFLLFNIGYSFDYNSYFQSFSQETQENVKNTSTVLDFFSHLPVLGKISALGYKAAKESVRNLSRDSDFASSKEREQALQQVRNEGYGKPYEDHMKNKYGEDWKKSAPEQYWEKPITDHELYKRAAGNLLNNFAKKDLDISDPDVQPNENPVKDDLDI